MSCRARVHEQTAEGGRIIYLHAPRHYPNCQRWLHCVPTISSSFFHPLLYVECFIYLANYQLVQIQHGGFKVDQDFF